jgi:integrase-like protein
VIVTGHTVKCSSGVFGRWASGIGRYRRDARGKNPYVERLIGSIRRECLDYLVVINEGHLRRILAAYAHYYNDTRTHLALNKNTPAERVVQRAGLITRVPHLGGLHHSFVRI